MSARSLWLSAVPLVASTTSLLVRAQQNYCGSDLSDASAACRKTCATDGDCCYGMTCHDVGSSCDWQDFNTKEHSSCGYSFCDASNRCETPCWSGSSSDCPWGQSCFLGTSCLHIDPTDNYYCGYDWTDAAARCGIHCPSGNREDCPFGMSCYSNTLCNPPPLPPAPTPPITKYCGEDINDAKHHCWQPCTEDNECCYGLNCYEIGNSTCQAVVESAGPGKSYCGTSWCDAAYRCNVPCPSGVDAQCPSGERCFADTPCQPPLVPADNYYCGTTWDDAVFRCDVNCRTKSDDECPFGQRCYADTMCKDDDGRVPPPIPGIPGPPVGPTPPSPTPPTGPTPPSPTPPSPTPPSPTPPSPTPPSPTPPTSPTTPTVPSPPSPTPPTGPSPTTPTPPTGPTPAPNASPNFAPATPSLATILAVESALTQNQNNLEANVFVSETPDGALIPSLLYEYSDFITALRIVSRDGVGGKYFYMGAGSSNYGHEYGLVNIAAFLSQAMYESISNDICDERNVEVVNGVTPPSNACGQYGYSYQDFSCKAEEAYMQCNVDDAMELVAADTSTDGFYCGPISTSGISEPNAAGRTDVVGCCWWGRGVLQTRGICSFGKLNYHLGKRAFSEGRLAPFPTIDFCSNPEAVCDPNQQSNGLIWIPGLVNWLEQMQDYNNDAWNGGVGWNYRSELHEFVNGCMTNSSFIEAVSTIGINRGCHDPPCSSSGTPPDGIAERMANFDTVLTALGLPRADCTPTSPALVPTTKPTTAGAPTNGGAGGTSSPTIKPTATGTGPGGTPTTPPPTNSPGPGPGTGTSAPTRPPIENSVETVQAIETTLSERGEVLNDTLSELGNSSIYEYDSLVGALQMMYQNDILNHAFYLGGGGNTLSISRTGNTVGNNSDDILNANVSAHTYGLVNIAAFLAQSIEKTAKHGDVCDESNHDLVAGFYPISNSCGQEGQSYQDCHCSSSESHMECPLVPDMQITAVTSAQSADAPVPPPLKCAPKTVHPFTGYWDPETGLEIDVAPYSNLAGRSDVENCCWWGRGALLTRGVCKLGKLNYYLGRRAHLEGRPALFPEIDFCATPETICSESQDIRLKWVVGLFDWISSVQTFNEEGWNYIDMLHEFADGGMNTNSSFIHVVSAIVDRGCHGPHANVTYAQEDPERKLYFERVLAAFGLIDAPSLYPDPIIRPGGTRANAGHSLGRFYEMNVLAVAVSFLLLFY